jgi:hypothetical protein
VTSSFFGVERNGGRSNQRERLQNGRGLNRERAADGNSFVRSEP